MNEERSRTFRCPLCGHLFSKDDDECSGRCPLCKNCSLICCPRCRYQFVEESRTVNFLKRIFWREKDGKEVGR